MRNLSRKVITTAAALAMAATVPGLALAAGPAMGTARSTPVMGAPAMSAPASSASPMSHGPMSHGPMSYGAMARTATAPAGDLQHWTAWNSRVRDVQEALNKQDNDKLAVDGRLGPKTRAAIAAFQTRNGLKATGIPDRATLARMNVVPRSA
jgi:murein L,D-transpeptidase YcbB/YkuD